MHIIIPQKINVNLIETSNYNIIGHCSIDLHTPGWISALSCSWPEQDKTLSIALAQTRPLHLVLLKMEFFVLVSHVEGARVAHGDLQVLSELPATRKWE